MQPFGGELDASLRSPVAIPNRPTLCRFLEEGGEPSMFTTKVLQKANLPPDGSMWGFFGWVSGASVAEGSGWSEKPSAKEPRWDSSKGFLRLSFKAV